MKLEREQQRQERREIQIKSEANTVLLGKLHAEVLELLRIAEMPDGAASNLSDEEYVVALKDTETQDTAEANVPVLTSAPYDPVKSFTHAQTQFQSMRASLEEQYFDVIASQYFTPQEIDKYFPTPQERKNLQSHTFEMQKAVVSKIRTLVSEIPNATQAQKSKLGA